MNQMEVINIWKNADAVCFDVDSTVIKHEAIDELALFCDKLQEVSELTSSAMSGKMSFREALTKRLNIIKPSFMQIQSFINLHPLKLSSNIEELVRYLRHQKVEVFLITGGFRCIISPVAQYLGIPESHVYANRFRFTHEGEFDGFDVSELTSDDGGKACVISQLKKRKKFKNLVMIGDGITDILACPPADAFIGYGGNVIREEVREKSEFYVTDFKDLLDIHRANSEM